ncbi:MAG: hypothetical protein M3Q27_18410 [Actinomycetota bacterium]|nr:hypothetical protein [Actinomycetota bacterium]
MHRRRLRAARGKLLLVTLLRRVVVDLVAGQRLRPRPRITLTAGDGLHCRVSLR